MRVEVAVRDPLAAVVTGWPRACPPGGCNLPSDLATLDRKLAIFREHCAAAGRDPAQAEVTVLDMPVIGRDGEDAASIVERLHGRTAAAEFARRRCQDGVRLAPDLAGPEDVLRLAPVAAAFA